MGRLYFVRILLLEPDYWASHFTTAVSVKIVGNVCGAVDRTYVRLCRDINLLIQATRVQVLDRRSPWPPYIYQFNDLHFVLQYRSPRTRRRSLWRW